VCLEEGGGQGRREERSVSRPEEDKENLHTDLGLLSEGGGGSYYGGEEEEEGGGGYGTMEEGDGEDDETDDKGGKQIMLTLLSVLRIRIRDSVPF
jgi:hypothetical protein